MNNAVNLKIRGRLVSSHQVPVLDTRPDVFASHLSNTINTAPALFKHAPVVLDLTNVPEITEQELADIIYCCRESNLVPFSVTGEPHQKPLARQLNFAWLEPKKTGRTQSNSTTIERTEVITKPVRSGQQIYAKDANLLIMNQVSAGAEVIADGNVHIFGALRGRAIAGAQGAAHCEIICQQMNAELVAIAGTYIVKEDFPSGEGAARCYLSEDSITIDYL